MSGVYTIKSTGQLIRFIIGIVSFGKTTNSITINAIQKFGREQPTIEMTIAYATSGKN